MIDPGYTYSNATGSMWSALIPAVPSTAILLTGSTTYNASGSAVKLLISGSASGSVTLASGGTMHLGGLATGVTHEFRVTTITLNSGNLFVLR
jgi:hypothetical protein